MLPTLSQVCTLPAGFAQEVEDFAAGQCQAMEIWLTKLEEHLKTHALDDVRRLLGEHEMAVPVASFQGGLLVSQSDERRAHWEHFRQRLALCHSLRITTIVVACDVAGPLSQQVLDRASASLAQAAAAAGECGVRVALEFQRSAAFGNNLQTAAAMVAETNSPHLGLCLDAFHFFTGPSKLEDLGYLTKDNLFHVQLCDVAGIPRELASDSDRILPGDGDFWLAPVVEHLQRINYDGCVSIELMNPHLWQVPPRQFGEVAMTALRKILGQAEM
jgi:4-hydroxyphenylpyruvate dioxygenase